MEQYDSVVDGMRDFNIMCVSTMAARSKGMAVKAIGIGLTSPSGWTQSHWPSRTLLVLVPSRDSVADPTILPATASISLEEFLLRPSQPTRRNIRDRWQKSPWLVVLQT